jgi:endonuclease/exonuclease/phosphatase family metal-dependent hydrolase
MKIISWNLLRLEGAKVGDLARIIAEHHPDLLLMQEATSHIDELPDRVGGYYSRIPLPGRIHGLAAWSPNPLPQAMHLPLPGNHYHRLAQIINLGPLTVVNVHLSHGPVMSRRQLRRIAKSLPATAVVIGDYNLIGPALLPGFIDAGPREPTHYARNILPVRIDRCLIRGVACKRTEALNRGPSDHRPIVVELMAA